jgi:hypothetical protein
MSTPEAIRDALARDDFVEAARLFEQLVRGAADPAALAEARKLVALALAARAQLQYRLDSLRSRGYVARAYASAIPRE